MSKVDIREFTQAPLRMEGSIDFEGIKPERVFEVLGDPLTIPEWYLLAKEIRMHPQQPGEDIRFNVVFTFFGDVYEEVLHWAPPKQYIYLAQGPEFPIKDYVSEIEVIETGATSGTMYWRVYCDIIEGEHYQKILPVMLPAINQASLEKLAPLIGGTHVRCRSFFSE